MSGVLPSDWPTLTEQREFFVDRYQPWTLPGVLGEVPMSDGRPDSLGLHPASIGLRLDKCTTDGERVAETRAIRGWSQRHLAEMLTLDRRLDPRRESRKITGSMICQIETGVVAAWPALRRDLAARLWIAETDLFKHPGLLRP